jgi:hypothetical protein
MKKLSEKARKSLSQVIGQVGKKWEMSGKLTFAIINN